MSQGTKTLSQLRSRLELMMSIPSGNAYVNSTPELEDINEAYQATAYAYNWPSTIKQGADIVIANNNRYSLAPDFRKFRFITVQDVRQKEEEVEFNMLERTRRGWAIDRQFGEYWIHDIPTVASVIYSLQANYSAGDSVVITLDTVSGLSTKDRIFINGTTPEFTTIQAIDTTNKTITARLKNATGASKKLYLVKDIIYFEYFVIVTLLANSGDVTILEPGLDYIMLEKAASLAYARLEMFAESDKWQEMWKRDMADAWSALSKNSTGGSTQFTI